MSNRVTLAALRAMSSQGAEALPADQIALLLEDVATLKADAKTLDEKLHRALDAKYGALAQTQRRAGGKDTGSVRWTDGDMVIVADLPKRVTWAQEPLRKVAQELRALGESVEEYIEIKYDVAERKFTAWPSKLQAMFSEARTVGVGKATYRIERKEAA